MTTNTHNNNASAPAEGAQVLNLSRPIRSERRRKFPIKPYLGLARKVFEDAQGSNDMGVIADLLEAKACAEALAEALAHTLDGLFNETYGKQDSPWIASIKASAKAKLAQWKEAQQ